MKRESDRTYLVVGDELGYIKLWDFTPFLAKLGLEPTKKHVESRPSFNPYRQELVDSSAFATQLRRSLKAKNVQLL